MMMLPGPSFSARLALLESLKTCMYSRCSLSSPMLCV